MAAYGNSNPGDDYYGDGPAPAAAPAQQPDEEEQAGQETALIPKSLLAGKEFKPGDEVVLKIVRFHDDEVEVAYATGEEEEHGAGEEEAEPGAPAPGGDAEMASMMT